MTQPWPDIAALRRLPDNHRRAVRSTLATVLGRLPALIEAGVASAPPDDLATLRALLAELDPAPARRNLEAVRVALLVQSEELAPRRMAGYGPIDPDQGAALTALVERLRAALAPREKER